MTSTTTKTNLKWEDITNSITYSITLSINNNNENNPILEIIIKKGNQYSSLSYQALYTLPTLIQINAIFSHFDSIELITSFMSKLVANNQINIIQEMGTKILTLTLLIPESFISELNKETNTNANTEAQQYSKDAINIPLTLNLNTTSIDKDAIIEELTSTVSYLNTKIELLTCKLNHIDSNSIKQDQFNEMIRRIERVSTGLPSYNSIFVNPNIDQQLVNRYKAIASNDILVNLEEDRQMIQQWIAPGKRIKMTLVYKASSDSFKADAFHSKCDYCPKTLILIKSDLGIRFGGYTEVTWNSDVDFKADDSAFLFSIERKEKYSIKEGTQCAIFCRRDYGPTFGEGFDLCIADNCKYTDGNYSIFPTSYGKGFEKHSLTSHNRNFKVAEIEVYHIEYDYYH